MRLPPRPRRERGPPPPAPAFPPGRSPPTRSPRAGHAPATRPRAAAPARPAPARAPPARPRVRGPPPPAAASPPRARAPPPAGPAARRVPPAPACSAPSAPARPTRGRAPPPRTRRWPPLAPAPPAGRGLLPGPAAARRWRALGRRCAAVRRRAPGRPPAAPTRASHQPGGAPPRCDAPRPCAALGPPPPAPAPPLRGGPAPRAGPPPAARPADPDRRAIEQVLALPRAGEPACDEDFLIRDREGSIRVVEDQGDLRHVHRPAPGRALEDDVFHLAAAQQARRLLAQDPADGIGDVGLAAAVRPHDRGDSRFERQLDRARERLEARQLESGQPHGVVSPAIRVTSVAWTPARLSRASRTLACSGVSNAPANKRDPVPQDTAGMPRARRRPAGGARSLREKEYGARSTSP